MIIEISIENLLEDLNAGNSKITAWEDLSTSFSTNRIFDCFQNGVRV